MAIGMSEQQKTESTPGTLPMEASAGPHTIEPGVSTQRMMFDVLLGLAPATCAALWVFHLAAVVQILTAVATALITEWILCRLRGKPTSLTDGSVCITALILAFSLPPALPVYATVLGSFVAVALGRMAFGGLGHNIFNPAMVGRAFLMLCFPAAMTSWSAPDTIDVLSGATPLAAAKFSQEYSELQTLLTGNVAGSLGETSVVLLAIGGIWLLARGAADWRLTIGMLLGVVTVAGIEQIVRLPVESFGIARHLCSGGVMLGAFFIVTDPVTSPLTKKGRWAFGLLAGVLTMIIRLFAGYPEGVMFAVLICNAVAPLLDRWTAPVPVGGKTRPM